MSAARWVNGAAMPPRMKATALAMYVHRFTGDHKPSWACKPRPDGTAYQVQFASDAEWLANTEFAVTSDGQRFDNRVRRCQCRPTFPNGVNAP